MQKITWFRHSHENRNDLLRFGLMRLHYQGEVQYIEKPFADAKHAGFSQAILNYPDLRHLSFLLFQNGQRKVKCLVDNEDSFALITPLIADVDVCFCAGYNSDFFERKQFVRPYGWQDETDIRWYRNTIEKKIDILGRHFYKIRKFIPIAPNQGSPFSLPGWQQRYKNLLHRLNRFIGKGNDFSDVYKGFALREAYLNDLRDLQLSYDVVLNDSLWGWPQHRINLHRRLKDLQLKQYRIYSKLNWTAPIEHDGSVYKQVPENNFPLETGMMNEPYEIMLAKSRLAVFACGFHWGWRNIMMLALRTGIPVLTDRLLTEAYFDMNEFNIVEHEDHLWTSIEPTLKSIDEQQWENWKQNNQVVYDKYMSPETVAEYFLKTV